MINILMPIEDLRGRLKRSLEERHIDQKRFGAPEKMEAVVREIGKRVDRFQIDTVIPRNRKLDALNNLYKSEQDGLTISEMGYLCWGLAEKVDERNILIEDKVYFVQFFKQLKNIFNEGRLSVKSWRGLLITYLKYEPPQNSTNGDACWKGLREFLLMTHPAMLKRQKHARPWMETLNNHKNLLQDDPCRRYTKALVEGDFAEVDSIRDTLKIPEESWFWRKLIIAQIEEIASYDHSGFKQKIENLIAEAKKHPLVVNDALKRLLVRYSKCDSRETHEALKQFAIETWGSPQLYRETRWGLVPQDVKTMVLGWLALEDLEDFFNVLKNERAVDERRLEFWRGYIKQMDFTKICFGRDAALNPARDYVELRDKKKGRWSRLSSGPSENNAFIMKIGRYVFVEFSQTGNACYGYDFDQLPFKLDDQEFSLLFLKRPNQALFRGKHADRGDAAWEEIFVNNLSGMGIYKDADNKATRWSSKPGDIVRRGAKSPKKEFPAGRSTNQTPETNEDSNRKRSNEDAIMRVIKAHNLDSKDWRSRGGYLWISDDDNSRSIAELLRKMGLLYRPNKGFYLP